MFFSANLSGAFAALLAAVLTALGAPLPHAAPPPAAAAAAGMPAPDAIVIKRDGAEVSFLRIARPRTSSVAARVGTAAGLGATAGGAATVAGGSRLDLDADGGDEVVVGTYLVPGGYNLIVEYSSLPYRDYLSAPIPSPTRPNFGDVLTSGDFNGDGYADLAVSNQGEFVPGDPNGAFAGAVWIFYGSDTGLDPASVAHINQNVAGVPDDMEAYDVFGAGVAAGDINGDGYDEITIGAPGESIGTIEPAAGSATVLFGSPTGVTTAGAFAITQDSPGVPNDAEPYDSFGSGVAIGDMTGDGYADLAVGSSGERSPTCPSCEQGMVVLIPGTAAGLDSTAVTMLHGSTDLPVSTLGEYLVMSDIDVDGRSDLIAATPRSSGGAISFIPGTPAGLSAAGVRVINEDTPGVPSDWVCCQTDGNGEAFGFSVATGDVTGDGYPDVLASNVGQDVAGAVDAGSAILLPGSAAGLTGAGSVMITQRVPSPLPAGRKPLPGQPYQEVAETGDRFGYSVSIANLDGAGPAELLVGTDWEVNPGEANNLASGFLMALRFEGSVPRRGSTVAPPGRLVPVMSWPGTAFAAPGITVYRMGSSMLHS